MNLDHLGYTLLSVAYEYQLNIDRKARNTHVARLVY